MSGEALGVIRLPAGPDKEGTPFAAAISADGKRLAVGGFPLNRGKSGIPIYILSTDTGTLERVVLGAREVPRSCDFSPDGKQLVVACVNGFVQVIEIETGKKVYEVQGHPGDIRHVRFNPKQPLISSVGRENDVKIWSLADANAPVATFRLGDKGPSSSDWTSDGKTLAVGCTSGELFLYDSAGKHLKTVPAIKEKEAPIQIARMKFLPDNKRVVFGGVCYSGWAGVIDVETDDRPVLVREHTNTVATVTCSADGLLAASCGGEFNETLVWTAADGAIGRRFAATTRGLWAVGWGRDGKSLAWGTTNRHTADGLSPLDTTLRLEDFSTGGSPEPAAFQQHVREDRGLSVKMDDFYHFTARRTASRSTSTSLWARVRPHLQRLHPPGEGNPRRGVVHDVPAGSTDRQADPAVPRRHRTDNGRGSITRRAVLRHWLLRPGGAGVDGRSTRTAAVDFPRRPRVDRLDPAGLLRLLRRTASGSSGGR